MKHRPTERLRAKPVKVMDCAAEEVSLFLAAVCHATSMCYNTDTKGKIPCPVAYEEALLPAKEWLALCLTRTLCRPFIPAKLGGLHLTVVLGSGYVRVSCTYRDDSEEIVYLHNFNVDLLDHSGLTLYSKTINKQLHLK